MIEVKDLRVIQGAFELRGVSFAIPKGEYAILMGKTGCGKTTIIEVLCGLRGLTSGMISLHGLDITALHPAKREIGYVPQDGALFPTMSVRDNISFALELRSLDIKEKEERVRTMAERLHISPLLDRGIAKLSGGERQRVALARALVFEPSFLLLDEPLSALDDVTHTEMCDVLKRITKELGVTVLHVTHHIGEAKTLADTLLNLKNGTITEMEP